MRVPFAKLWMRFPDKSRAVLLVTLGLTIPASQAQRASVAPWMTGEQMLQRLEPVKPANVPWGPESEKGILPTRELVAEHHTMMNREFVEGYIHASHDASEGKSWCFNEKYQVPNGEVFWNESIWGLRALTAAQLKQNASDLLAEIWRAKWPCPPHQRSQK